MAKQTPMDSLKMNNIIGEIKNAMVGLTVDLSELRNELQIRRWVRIQNEAQTD